MDLSYHIKFNAAISDPRRASIDLDAILDAAAGVDNAMASAPVAGGGAAHAAPWPGGALDAQSYLSAPWIFSGGVKLGAAASHGAPAHFLHKPPFVGHLPTAQASNAAAAATEQSKSMWHAANRHPNHHQQQPNYQQQNHHAPAAAATPQHTHWLLPQQQQQRPHPSALRRSVSDTTMEMLFQEAEALTGSLVHSEYACSLFGDACPPPPAAAAAPACPDSADSPAATRWSVGGGGGRAAPLFQPATVTTGVEGAHACPLRIPPAHPQGAAQPAAMSCSYSSSAASGEDCVGVAAAAAPPLAAAPSAQAAELAPAAVAGAATAAVKPAAWCRSPHSPAMGSRAPSPASQPSTKRSCSATTSPLQQPPAPDAQPLAASCSVTAPVVFGAQQPAAALPLGPAAAGGAAPVAGAKAKAVPKRGAKEGKKAPRRRGA
jgi:hypothetical protein